MYEPRNHVSLNKHIDPDEMPRSAAFCQDLFCLLKYPLIGFQVHTDLKGHQGN